MRYQTVLLLLESFKITLCNIREPSRNRHNINLKEMSIKKKNYLRNTAGPTGIAHFLLQ
jgi:hypothetical protein